MTMTMRQVLKAAPKSRHFSASFVKITRVKTGRHPDTNAPVIKAQSYSTHNHKGERKKYTPNRYVTTIEVYSGRYVVVACSCDDFWAVWEVALSKRGAARIEYSNGERPKERNPQMIPGCCKHILHLGETLVNKGKL